MLFGPVRAPIPPGPGQESVWDYPRPPRLEASTRHIQVVFNGVVIAETTQAQRVLETSHPPVYYIPPTDVRPDILLPSDYQTWCEWKGMARYWNLQVGDRRVENGAWYYPNPTPTFQPIADYLAFYPGKMDACFIDGKPVQAQAGGLYGGWITEEIVGPFKGEPGTWGW